MLFGENGDDSWDEFSKKVGRSLLPLPLIPIVIIHQVKIHGLFRFYGAVLSDGLVNSAVGQEGLLIFGFLHGIGKDPDSVCDDRNQVCHYKIVAAVCYLDVYKRQVSVFIIKENHGSLGHDLYVGHFGHLSGIIALIGQQISGTFLLLTEKALYLLLKRRLVPGKDVYKRQTWECGRNDPHFPPEFPPVCRRFPFRTSDSSPVRMQPESIPDEPWWWQNTFFLKPGDFAPGSPGNRCKLSHPAYPSRCV